MAGPDVITSILLPRRPAGAGAAPPAAGAAAPPAASAAPARTRPLFVAPPTLLEWNRLLGTAGFSDVVPIEVVVVATVPAGATAYPIVYQVGADQAQPDDYVSFAMSAFTGELSYHSPLLTAQGFLEYGTPYAVPVTPQPVPLTTDYHLARAFTTNTVLTNNITVLVANGTTYDVTITARGAFLEVTRATYDRWYAHFQHGVDAWIRAVLAGQYEGAPTS